MLLDLVGNVAVASSIFPDHRSILFISAPLWPQLHRWIQDQAYSPSAHLIDYASTKAAINNFTKGLATQLAPKGIRVNSVAPGPIWTPLQVSDGQPKDALPHFGKNTPLGRAEQPTELAPAYVFLTSTESSYVIGETLNVNGGQPTP